MTNGVPNLVQVSPGIWRGGQPTDEGWLYLKSLGVTNVVKLNLESEGSDSPAEAIGMVVHRHPIPFWQQLFGPVKQDMRAIADEITPGTYLHCAHGHDRTGLAIAVYRHECEGWMTADAEKEMLQLGFHKSLQGLWEYWEDYERR